jgi:hypothetical protein
MKVAIEWVMMPSWLVICSRISAELAVTIFMVFEEAL